MTRILNRFGKMLAISAGLGLAGNAASAENLIVSAFVTPNDVASTHGITPWMECVQGKSGNEISFDYFPSGQLGSATDTLDVLNTGIANVSYVFLSVESARLPLTGIAMLPDMGETVTEMVGAFRKMLVEGGPIESEIENNNIKFIFFNPFPVYQIVARGEPIDTVEKFNGKKLRVAGTTFILGAESLGAAPVEMSITDTYMGLQQGTIDGTISAFASIKSYNLDEVIRSVSSNASFGVAAAMVAMDMNSWNKLTPEQQTFVVDCGLQIEGQLAEHMDEQNRVIQQDLADAGITVYEFSAEDRQEINQRLLEGVSHGYVARLAERGLPAQEVFDAYREALGK